MELSGTPAVVTGGASGLGAATARALVEAGARVAILDADEDTAHATATEIGAAAYACDVTDGPSTEAALQAAAAADGVARIVVSCAGIQLHAPVVSDDGPMPLETFRRVIDVNLVGTFNVIRLAAQAMSETAPLPTGERGVIVNVASIAAFDGQPLRTPYCASKGGVVALTLPLARELAPHGIRVMAISPGHFTTPLARHLTQEQIASHLSSIVFPTRLGDPSEFAAFVLHICTNEMFNGENVRLDAATRMPRG